MRRDRGERLEVHREFLRRALDPQLRLLLIGEGVIRGVVLDEREPFRIEPKTFVGLLGNVVRIPTRLEKSWIRPRARSDEDLLHHSQSVRGQRPGGSAGPATLSLAAGYAGP